MSIIATTLLSLNPEIRKYELMNQHVALEDEPGFEAIISEEDTTIDLKSCYYINNVSGSYSEILKNELISFSCQINNVESKISNSVLNQSLKILDYIYPSLIEKLDIENMYSTSYGTVVFDWESSNDSLFSLEVGKNSLGYFIEKNGNDIKEVDSLSLSTDNIENTFSSLIKDLSDFI